MFEVEDVHYAYPGSTRAALDGVSLRIPPGARTAVVGPNGAGKSTLLRLLLGLAVPDRGQVRFDNRPSASWGRREMSRRVAVVAQELPAEFPFTVREFVGMGRHPYLRPWAALGQADRLVVERALAETDLESLAERDLGSLSGGELQRARLAQALAQEPRMLLLDEPTAHLDIGHEMAFFERVAERVRDSGTGVLAITHDLNLAARFADRMVLLADGRILARGAPMEVLCSDAVEAAFGCPVRIVEVEGLGPWVVPLYRRS